MRTIIHILLLLLAGSSLLTAQPGISAEGNNFLKEIDSNLLPETTVFYRKLINIEPNGTKKEFVLFSAKKGKDKILSTFLEPKTEKGRHTLRVGDNMWLYVPNVGKPLRITSLQSVTGGLFNNSDIMRLDFSEEYNVAEYKKNESALILKAKTKSVAYDKLIMQYDKKYKVPTVIECYTASDMLVKTLRFKNIKDFGNKIIRPEIIETDSPLYKGYKSVMIYAKIQKKKIADEIFSVNSMEKILELR
ncbi:MAG: outer membrane lipoprotein-sorting protein [Spirochaetes bacterium]|nr:outer membrane lipoprotein-sorting protein [Spirochaetota bacterium]